MVGRVELLSGMRTTNGIADGGMMTFPGRKVPCGQQWFRDHCSCGTVVRTASWEWLGGRSGAQEQGVQRNRCTSTAVHPSLRMMTSDASRETQSLAQGEFDGLG